MNNFVDVSGYEGIYKVNPKGEVFSVRTNKILKPVIRSGYYSVDFSVDGVKCLKLVHRLVAETFIPNPENKQTVNHVNGNKKDNNVINLEWATPSENSKHAFDNGLVKFGDRKGKNNPASKLNKETINKVKELLKNGLNQTTVATLINISQVTVSRIKRNLINADIYD